MQNRADRLAKVRTSPVLQSDLPEEMKLFYAHHKISGNYPVAEAIEKWDKAIIERLKEEII